MDLLQKFLTPFVKIGPQVPEALFTLFVGYIVIKFVTRALKKFLRLEFVKVPKSIEKFSISLIKIVFWFALIVIVFDNLGLGKLALAISGYTAVLAFFLSFGMGGLISDVVSGFFLAGDKDFNIGDKVSVGEKPIEGIIESVDIRKSRVRDDDGFLHVIPNSLVEKKEWVVIEKTKDQRLKTKDKKVKISRH